MWREPMWWTVVVTVAALMEPWAMFVHARVWHGPLMWGHRSHHARDTGQPGAAPAPNSWFEFNDLFSLGHAGVAITLIALGVRQPGSWNHALMVAVGAGMTLFGVGYFLVHDGFIHGRLPLGFLARMRWFRLLRNAHRAHHGPRGGAPYGLFLGPQELRWERQRARRSLTAIPQRIP
ncbi:MAG: sterol desaturase family protein [Myxococcales bacterium]|nr:sterol desaturase family protein [Myxococcales bacterium]